MQLKSLLILSLLAGCNSVPTVQTVKVAIPVKCTFAPIAKPIEYFKAARIEDSLYDKVSMLISENLERQAYELQLEAALMSCATPLEVFAKNP